MDRHRWLLGAVREGPLAHLWLPRISGMRNRSASSSLMPQERSALQKFRQPAFLVPWRDQTRSSSYKAASDSIPLSEGFVAERRLRLERAFRKGPAQRGPQANPPQSRWRGWNLVLQGWPT